MTTFVLVDGAGARDVDERRIDELVARGDRPLAIDREEAVAYLGIGAETRGSALASLQAPDFTLPDLAGRRHTLAEHRGEKVLLVAWASW